MATIADSGQSATPASAKIPATAIYALVVMTLANLLNYVDRQIPSILAQSIKSDLKLDDAQLGFLMGTAFAVFYSVVGIAMGRISDLIPRKKVMAFSMVLWSAMTAFGGLATSFGLLSVARIGVGVGEAAANPCSHSLIADVFPSRNRALALSCYMAGVFLGGTGAMIVGGVFVQHWHEFCVSVPIASACGIANWKAALITVGLPGIPFALLLLAIREPSRPRESKRGTASLILREFAAAIPPLTLLTVFRLGGARALTRNLLLVAGLGLVALAMNRLTGDVAQWAAFALGAYAIVTWGQVQSMRDHALYRLTFGCPTFVMAMLSTALMACASGAVSSWTAPYAMRSFALSPTRIGLTLGLTTAAGSVLGVLLGGGITDWWKRRDLRAPIGMAAISVAGILPSVVALVAAKEVTGFVGAVFSLAFFAAFWSGANAAMIQDLVLPRMRGAAAAAYSLVAIVIASGIGPYWAGKISTLTHSLVTGMLSLMVLMPIAALLLWLTARRLPQETPEARLARAVAAGEPA